MKTEDIGNLIRQIFAVCTAPAMLATIETDRRLGEMFIELAKAWVEAAEEICGKE